MVIGRENLSLGSNIKVKSQIYADDIYKVGLGVPITLNYSSQSYKKAFYSNTYMSPSASYVRDNNQESEFKNRVEFDLKIGEEIVAARRLNGDLGGRIYANAFYELNCNEKGFSNVVGAEAGTGLFFPLGKAETNIDINVAGYRSIDNKEINPNALDCVNLGNGWGATVKGNVFVQTPSCVTVTGSVFAYGEMGNVKPGGEIGLIFKL